MIVVEREHCLRVTTQTDHAHFAGQLLTLWPGLADHPHRQTILFAARHHDNGWQEADAAPLLHPDGDRPHDFLSIPPPVYASIWERGTARYAEESPHVALLITEHALKIRAAAPRDGEEARVLESLAARRTELLEHWGDDEDQLAEDYRWLAIADFLSLVVCNDWSAPFDRGGMRGVFDGDCLRLAPFPLAGSTTFRIPCRDLPRRPYAGDGDLATALANCAWYRRSVRVAPDQTAV